MEKHVQKLKELYPTPFECKVVNGTIVGINADGFIFSEDETGETTTIYSKSRENDLQVGRQPMCVGYVPQGQTIPKWIIPIYEAGIKMSECARLKDGQIKEAKIIAKMEDVRAYGLYFLEDNKYGVAEFEEFQRGFDVGATCNFEVAEYSPDEFFVICRAR